MPIKHKIKQGECISSISEKYGFLPDTIWNDHANSGLVKKRKNPNTLSSGDIVTIPDKRLKEERCNTEQRYKFRKKNTPAKLEIVLMCGDEPRANESYILDIGGYWIKGITDQNGKIEIYIPPDVKGGKLILIETEEEYDLRFGEIDPASEISGAQARLKNMGIYDGPIDGKEDTLTKEAIKEFQKRYEMEETGGLNEVTQNKLIEIYGC